MTEPRDQPEAQAAPVRTIGTALQFLLVIAFLADLVFLATLGLHLSDGIEATGLTLAAGSAILLLAALIRVTRRIGASGPAEQG
ncbi:hypothetical protein JL100_011345 [Skermanella mucosa]|uniref:hypothetical protein n=1 Tax=Skermanella mucosa TaxID=1789672 RepID=UPI00192C5AE9|nr:hypothetical protein [Skermanella mucosa]UEM23293.1 hypothetical protein JL100_011345 [Skermanella mucosa]